jgi:hypothetical protein
MHSPFSTWFKYAFYSDAAGPSIDSQNAAGRFIFKLFRAFGVSVRKQNDFSNLLSVCATEYAFCAFFVPYRDGKSALFASNRDWPKPPPILTSGPCL